MSFDYRGDKKPSTQLEAPTSSFMANGDQKPLVVDTIPDDSDVRSVSSDIDNERVREKLKKTTIAPASSRSSSWAKMADEDETMDSANDTTEEGKRRARKRSHDESDEEKVEGDDGKQRRRQKAHERKRSREILEQDRIRAGSGLERVKTPPTHIEESDAIAERVSSPKGLERKRSLGKLDKEDDADQKKKITKTEEERQESQELENKTESEIADDNMKDKVELKVGFLGSYVTYVY
jgi:Ran-binding protein 3